MLIEEIHQRKILGLPTNKHKGFVTQFINSHQKGICGSLAMEWLRFINKESNQHQAFKDKIDGKTNSNSFFNNTNFFRRLNINIDKLPISNSNIAESNLFDRADLVYIWSRFINRMKKDSINLSEVDLNVEGFEVVYRVLITYLSQLDHLNQKSAYLGLGYDRESSSGIGFDKKNPTFGHGIGCASFRDDNGITFKMFEANSGVHEFKDKESFLEALIDTHHKVATWFEADSNSLKLFFLTTSLDKMLYDIKNKYEEEKNEEIHLSQNPKRCSIS